MRDDTHKTSTLSYFHHTQAVQAYEHILPGANHSCFAPLIIAQNTPRPMRLAEGALSSLFGARTISNPDLEHFHCHIGSLRTAGYNN